MGTKLSFYTSIMMFIRYTLCLAAIAPFVCSLQGHDSTLQSPSFYDEMVYDEEMRCARVVRRRLEGEATTSVKCPNKNCPKEMLCRCTTCGEDGTILCKQSQCTKRTPGWFSRHPCPKGSCRKTCPDCLGSGTTIGWGSKCHDAVCFYKRGSSQFATYCKERSCFNIIHEGAYCKECASPSSSASYPEDKWPSEIIRAHRRLAATLDITKEEHEGKRVQVCPNYGCAKCRAAGAKNTKDRKCRKRKCDGDWLRYRYGNSDKILKCCGRKDMGKGDLVLIPDGSCGTVTKVYEPAPSNDFSVAVDVVFDDIVHKGVDVTKALKVNNADNYFIKCDKPPPIRSDGRKIAFET